MEKVDRLESPQSQTTTTSVTLDRNAPEYCGSFDPLDDTGKEDALANLRNAHRGVVNVLRDFRQREAEIAADKRYTEAGRLDVLARELPTFEGRTEFANLEKIIDSREGVARELEKDLLSDVVPDVSKLSAAGAVRHGEIRSWFAKLDRSEQLRAVQNALNDDGDKELLSAVISTPKAMRTLPDQIHDHLIERLLKQKSPKAVAELQRIQRHVETAKFGLAKVRELLRAKAAPLSMRDRMIVGTGR